MVRTRVMMISDIPGGGVVAMSFATVESKPRTWRAVTPSECAKLPPIHVATPHEIPTAPRTHQCLPQTTHSPMLSSVVSLAQESAAPCLVPITSCSTSFLHKILHRFRHLIMDHTSDITLIHTQTKRHGSHANPGASFMAHPSSLQCERRQPL